jgi:hypothetical protein
MPPPFAAAFGGDIDARSAPDGTGPSGTAVVDRGRAVLSNSGSVSCLRVAGNRAAVGLIGQPAGSDVAVQSVMFIEDNGPTGDRWATIDLPSTTSPCPDPATATFPPIDVGILLPPTITTGGFDIHDHHAGP